METFGQRLTRLRKEKNLTQQQLAEQLNISRQALSAWERDKTEPDLQSLTLLCDILEIEMNDLLGQISLSQKKLNTKLLTLLYVINLMIILMYSVFYLKQIGDFGMLFTQHFEFILFLLMSSTIYFVFYNAIESGDFSLVSGYDPHIKYNQKELANMVYSMAFMILLDTIGYVIICILFDYLVVSEYAKIAIVICYIVTFIMTILVNNYKYKNKIYLNLESVKKYSSTNVITYHFLGMIALLITTIILTNVYFKVPNNSSTGVMETLILLPTLMMNVIVLITEQDYAKKIVDENQVYHLRKKVLIADLITIVAAILIFLIGMN